MRNLKKIASSFLITAYLTVSSYAGVPAIAASYHQTVTRQNITSGAVLDQIVQFTDAGWLNINVMRVDLTNPNIKVDTLTGQSSISQLTRTQTLAQNAGAVGAMNGGFFFFPENGHPAEPIGPMMQSGAWSKIDVRNNMATFSINAANQALMDYLKTTIKLTSQSSSQTIDIGRLNARYFGYTDFTMYNTKWSIMSIGREKCADIVEMVVADDIVTEIRYAQPAVSIPQNGYVIVTRAAGGEILKQKFKVGDKVALDISTAPDWSKLQMAVTGGAMLLKNGQVPQSFSHYKEVQGASRHPRTAIGSTQDGKHLLLVTVDGRQQSSIGMTLNELAQYMKSLGAYNALNLDGGGSTTMVARAPGTSRLDVMSRPSDGTQRGIANAIGIFTLAPPSELAGLIIDTIDANIFVNTSRSFYVRGYDKYFNPVEVKPEQIQWSISGVEGKFEKNTLYPQSVGEAKVKATIGTVTAELPVSILSSPVQITLSDKQLKLVPGQTHTFSLSGRNKNGYSGYIHPKDVAWKVHGNIGSFQDGIFTAQGTEAGYVDASIGNVHSYCGISVAVDTPGASDPFEQPNGTFAVYPEDIQGAYTLSEEQVHGGKFSGKLSYSFAVSDKSRAAYIVLNGQGMKLDKNASKVGVWVYNSHENSNWLGAWVYDSKGERHQLYFTKGMDWIGWKYLELSLAGIGTPAFLTRLYAVQTNPVADAGDIYFDDLACVITNFPEIKPGLVPADTSPADPDVQSIVYTPQANSFRFSVFGEGREPAAPLEKNLTASLVEKINNYIDIGAFVGASSHSSAQSVKKTVIATGTGYKSFDVKNSRFIQLDMSKQGLRASNTKQWPWLQEQLNTAKDKHVFVFLSAAPHTFTDSMESKLLQETLTEYRKKSGKNVWVFYKGPVNTAYTQRGVKYISCTGFDVSGLSASNQQAAQYALVTVRGNTVTYEFKPIK